MVAISLWLQPAGDTKQRKKQRWKPRSLDCPVDGAVLIAPSTGGECPTGGVCSRAARSRAVAAKVSMRQRASGGRVNAVGRMPRERQAASRTSIRPRSPTLSPRRGIGEDVALAVAVGDRKERCGLPEGRRRVELRRRRRVELRRRKLHHRRLGPAAVKDVRACERVRVQGDGAAACHEGAGHDEVDGQREELGGGDADVEVPEPGVLEGEVPVAAVEVSSEAHGVVVLLLGGIGVERVQGRRCRMPLVVEDVGGQSPGAIHQRLNPVRRCSPQQSGDRNAVGGAQEEASRGPRVSKRQVEVVNGVAIETYDGADVLEETAELLVFGHRRRAVLRDGADAGDGVEALVPRNNAGPQERVESYAEPREVDAER